MSPPIQLQLLQLLLGFSVFAAMLLLFAWLFFIRDMRKTVSSQLSCAALLLSLTGLQLFHWWYLQTGADLFAQKAYVALLLLTPPSFYFFSREVLQPESRIVLSDLVHLSPVLLSLVMPAALVIPVALTVGAGYSIWLVWIVLGIRRQVRRFKFEVFFFAFFALLATLVLVLAVAAPFVSPGLFYVTYASMTAVALFLILGALVSFPELLSDISAAAEMTYAASTLKNVDVEAAVRQLECVMSEERLFENENLNLALLAEAVDLSSHQLSELINTHFGYGFSRYVRERRVAEAQKLLLSDKSASVLSVGLSTGFKSQSSFYTAFREITGQSPGEYRKNPGNSSQDS